MQSNVNEQRKVIVSPQEVAWVRLYPEALRPQGPAGGSVTVGTSQVQLGRSDHNFHRLTIVAASTNTGTVAVGGDGNTALPLAAGASITLEDVSPTAVYLLASTSGQTVAWLGYGNHLLTEGRP
jgi:hypothetical protein